MKEAIIIAVFAFVLLLVNAGQKTGADDPEQKPAVRTSEKLAAQRDQRQKTENARTEWLADPERGWIRTEERPLKERERSRVEDSKSRQQSLWEY
jgi:uncharacterized membrane protein YdbT with pleckstrin-like domain